MVDILRRARAEGATKQSRAPKLAEIAERIAAHLRRFEADPVLRTVVDGANSRRVIYRSPTAFQRGAKIEIVYAAIRMPARHYSDDIGMVTKAAAAGYLAWLDAGNVGRHWEWERAGETTSAAKDGEGGIK